MKHPLRRSVHLHFPVRLFPYRRIYTFCKRLFLLIGLLFVFSPSYAVQDTLTKAKDTAALLSVLKKSSNIIALCNASRKLGGYYNTHGYFERGLYLAARGLPYAQQSGSDSLLWLHYDLVADLHDNLLHFDSSIHYMFRSLALKKKHNNQVAIAGTYNDLGVVYGEKTQLVEQADYYIKAKKIYDQVGDTNEADRVALNLAGVYLRQGFHEKSLSAFHALIPRFVQKDYVNWLCVIYQKIAICFDEMDRRDSVFYYSDLEIDAAFNSWDYEINSFNAWSRRVYYCNRFKNYKNYRQSIDSMMYYAKIAKGDIDWRNYYVGLAQYHTTVTHQYDSALLFLGNAITSASLHSDKKSQMENYHNMAEVYRIKGEDAKAYEALLKAYRLKDSIVSQDGRQQFADMLTKYETEKKEAQILLLDKENKLRQRTTYFLIGGLGLLAIVLISLFRNNRLKQKTNKKLQTLNAALDEANQSKARLFSILSHDLRSPVSSLYSYLRLKKIAPQMLSEEKRAEKEAELFQNAGYLLNTMEDVLLWSKSQLENFVPEKTEVSLLHVLQQVLNIYQPYIVSKNICVILPDKDKDVFTDENMLQTIIRNIIANAVKYTPENGMIRVNFDDAHSPITFFNSGKPIDETILRSVFDWSHIGSSGSGYGLKLSKALADKLDMEISVKPQTDGNLFLLQMNRTR